MNQTALAHLAAGAAALSAGASVVATRYVVGETDPATLAFYRFAVAVLCFVPVLHLVRPKHRLRFTDYTVIAVLGVMFFGLFPLAFNASLQYIPAARGAVGLATIPIQTLIVAVIVGRERLTGSKTAGVAFAFAGIAIAFGPDALRADSPDYLLGDGLMLLGGSCAAVYSVFSRATLIRHGALYVTMLAMVFAVIMLAPIAYWQSGSEIVPSLTARRWLAVLFLGSIAGTVQASLFTWALHWLPPTNTVIYITLNPITAMLLGLLLMGEQLTPTLLAGIGLVVSGIFVGSGLAARLLRGIRKPTPTIR